MKRMRSFQNNIQFILYQIQKRSLNFRFVITAPPHDSKQKLKFLAADHQASQSSKPFIFHKQMKTNQSYPFGCCNRDNSFSDPFSGKIIIFETGSIRTLEWNTSVWLVGYHPSLCPLHYSPPSPISINLYMWMGFLSSRSKLGTSTSTRPGLVWLRTRNTISPFICRFWSILESKLHKF